MNLTEKAIVKKTSIEHEAEPNAQAYIKTNSPALL